METIFLLTNLLVMPFWALMIAVPRWSATRRLMASPWIVAPIALCYALLVTPQLPALVAELSALSLDSLAEALGTPAGTTTVWAHMLALDLFAGRWIFLDGRQRQINVWLSGALLFATLMAGPLGLLLYLIVRPWGGSVRGAGSVSS